MNFLHPTVVQLKTVMILVSDKNNVQSESNRVALIDQTVVNFRSIRPRLGLSPIIRRPRQPK